jgi:hypothetical protein
VIDSPRSALLDGWAFQRASEAAIAAIDDAVAGLEG